MKHIKEFNQFVNEAVKVDIPYNEWEVTTIDGDMGAKLVKAKWKGKYYSAYAYFGPGDEVVDIVDIQPTTKKEYDSFY